MKRTLILLLLLGGLAGCANRYAVTLTNGSVITSKGKPKLDESTKSYRFKDIQGQERIIPGFKITSIEPQ